MHIPLKHITGTKQAGNPKFTLIRVNPKTFTKSSKLPYFWHHLLAFTKEKDFRPYLREMLVYKKGMDSRD